MPERSAAPRHRVGAGGFALEVEVRLVADVDRDAKDRAAGKGAGVLVLFGDVVAAVEADAQSIPRSVNLPACARIGPLAAIWSSTLRT